MNPQLKYQGFPSDSGFPTECRFNLFFRKNFIFTFDSESVEYITYKTEYNRI